MNNKFDELTKNLAQSVTCRAALRKFGVSLALISSLALAVGAPAATLGPLIELSRPNAVAGCDDHFVTFPETSMAVDDAFEPFVAVNPVNPKNIVAVWIQGLLQNIIAAVSLDGGRTWQQVPVPFTICSGGPLLGAGDERVYFAPNGDAYVIAVVGNDMPTRGIAVCKSTDGGLHWSQPVILEGPAGLVPTDLAVMAPDPADARRLYAIWDGSYKGTGQGGPAVFTRTTDGGSTWEPPRPIVQPKPQDYVQFSQLIVLPDGTLEDVYELVNVNNSGHGIEQTFSLQVIRSTDHGVTWSSPIQALTLLPVYGPDGNMVNVDPETGQLVSDANSASITVDNRNGNIYAVWEDGRFSNSQYNEIAFSMSADGGLTWSAPIRVNQAPLSIPPLNRQSFYPAVAVAADGTIGVSYYDFRFNDPSPGLPTDRWLVRCQPTANRPATNPANWGNEVRLTDTSFNMEACGTLLGGFFPGDYYGLAAVGSDFVTTTTQVAQDNVTAIFFRRVSK
jgi:hypothetical protein